MTIRTLRRTRTTAALEEMDDDELDEIRFFGNIAKDGGIVFEANEKEKVRAGEIRRLRGDLQSAFRITKRKGVRQCR